MKTCLGQIEVDGSVYDVEVQEDENGEVRRTIKGITKEEVRKKRPSEFAKLGIKALIDEATGAEKERAPDALRNMLKEFEA